MVRKNANVGVPPTKHNKDDIQYSNSKSLSKISQNPGIDLSHVSNYFHTQLKFHNWETVIPHCDILLNILENNSATLYQQSIKLRKFGTFSVDQY